MVSALKALRNGTRILRNKSNEFGQQKEAGRTGRWRYSRLSELGQLAAFLLSLYAKLGALRALVCRISRIIFRKGFDCANTNVLNCSREKLRRP